MPKIKVTYKTVTGEEKDIAVDESLPLLDQLEASGVDQPSSCMSGACGTCRTKVLSGREHLDEEKFSMALYPVEDDEVLTCVCGIKDESVEDDGAVVVLEVVDD
jgi:ferredoxin